MKIEYIKKRDSDDMLSSLLSHFDFSDLDDEVIEILKKNFKKNVKKSNRKWYRILLSNGEWLNAYLFGTN